MVPGFRSSDIPGLGSTHEALSLKLQSWKYRFTFLSLSDIQKVNGGVENLKHAI